MNLGEILSLINYISNKDQTGRTMTPNQFNLLLDASNNDYFKKKYGLPEEYQPGQPFPAQSYEITQKITDDMRSFKKWLGGRDYPALSIDTSGRADIPTDYVHYSSIRYRKVTNSADCTTPTTEYKTIEVLTDAQIGDRLQNSIKMPTIDNPICSFYSDYIQFYPITLARTDFTYLRYPTTPIFGYTIVNDVEVYNPSTSTEIEWPDINHLDIVRIILSYIGINLREPQLFQYAEMKKKEGV